MFDMDRWLKRLWLVNGVLLLTLIVLSTGAIVVTWLSGALSGRNAVLAPDSTRNAAVAPRAVRYSPPRAIWGTKSRVVVVRYGRGQQGRGLGFGSEMNGSAFYDADGPVVNLLFLPATGAGRVLLDKPAFVSWFDYPSTKDDSLQRWITYRIALDDTNNDGRLDSDDRVDLFVSDLDGSNLRRVLPPGMRLLDHQAIGDGRHLVVTALQVPADFRGSDDELPQRAFLYDVPTGSTTPYAAVDSLVRNAANVLARP